MTARLWAAHHFPYLATGLFALTPVITSGYGTLGVDAGWHLYVDREVAVGLPIEQLGAVLLHEVSHLLRDHHQRAQSLGVGPITAFRWNVATDAEINDDLVASGLPVPHPVLPSRAGLCDGRLAEEYFEDWPESDLVLLAPLLIVECGSGVHGQHRPWDRRGPTAGLTSWEADLVRRGVADGIRDHDGPGTISASWRRWAQETLHARVNWRQRLRGEVRRAVASTTGCVDYSFTRPSRRAAAAPGVVLPTLRRPIATVAVVIDTSGSMSEDDLGQALAELDAILRASGVRARNVTAITCDAEVHAVERVTSGWGLELTGGGGTDMGVGIARAESLRPRPDITVVLTDGETAWPERAPDARIVVGIIGDNNVSTPPWATSVRIDVAS